MSNVAVLKAKLEKHQAYYDAKFAEYKQMDMSSKKSLNRYSRLLTLSNLITSLIIELNNEMAIAAFVGEEIVEGQQMTKRVERCVEELGKSSQVVGATSEESVEITTLQDGEIIRSHEVSSLSELILIRFDAFISILEKKGITTFEEYRHECEISAKKLKK